MSTVDTMQLTLGHSPDPDDAFMWWPLTGLDGIGPAIDTGRFAFTLETDDIESLNRRAEHGELDITAISIAHWPTVRDTYVLTACGASMGDGYGPKLVARTPMSAGTLASKCRRIAVPGTRTTALATARLLLGNDHDWVVLPFETIGAAIASGDVDAGVVIHEGQLTFGQDGLHLVKDLGAWWSAQHDLPLPLGGNVVRRDLETRGGDGTLVALADVLRRSVEHALANRDKSLAWAQHFGRGIDLDTADAFVAMYVNNWTLDFGPRGRAALRVFLEAVHADGGADPGSIDIITPQGDTLASSMGDGS